MGKMAPKPIELPKTAMFDDVNGAKVITVPEKDGLTSIVLEDEMEGDLFYALKKGCAFTVKGTYTFGTGRISFIESGSYSYGDDIPAGFFRKAKILKGHDLKLLIPKGTAIRFGGKAFLYQNHDGSYHVGILPATGIEILVTGEVVTLEAARAKAEKKEIRANLKGKESAKKELSKEKPAADMSAYTSGRVLARRFAAYENGFNPEKVSHYEIITFTRKFSKDELPLVRSGCTFPEVRIADAKKKDAGENFEDARASLLAIGSSIASSGQSILASESVLYAVGEDEFGPFTLPVMESAFTVKSYAAYYGWHTFRSENEEYVLIPAEDGNVSVVKADSFLGDDGSVDTCDVLVPSRGKAFLVPKETAKNETMEHAEAAQDVSDPEPVSKKNEPVQYLLLHYRYSVPLSEVSSITSGNGKNMSDPQIYKKSLSEKSVLDSLAAFHSTIRKDGDMAVIDEYAAFSEDEDGVRILIAESSFDFEEVCREAGLRIITVSGKKHALLRVTHSTSSRKSRANILHTICIEGAFTDMNDQTFKFRSADETLDTFQNNPTPTADPAVNMFALIA